MAGFVGIYYQPINYGRRRTLFNSRWSLYCGTLRPTTVRPIVRFSARCTTVFGERVRSLACSLASVRVYHFAHHEWQACGHRASTYSSRALSVRLPHSRGIVRLTNTNSDTSTTKHKTRVFCWMVSRGPLFVSLHRRMAYLWSKSENRKLQSFPGEMYVNSSINIKILYVDVLTCLFCLFITRELQKYILRKLKISIECVYLLNDCSWMLFWQASCEYKIWTI